MKTNDRLTKIDTSKVSDFIIKANELGWTDIISMAGGEPLFPPPENILNNIEKNFYNNSINKYPKFGGNIDLKNAIAQKFNYKNDAKINEQNIYLTPGGASAIYTTLISILNSGDEVLIQNPCWEHYPNIIKLAGGIPVYFNMEKNNSHYEIDWCDLEKRVSKNTKALLINSPLNPCGSVLNQKEFEKLLFFASKHNIWLIVDNEYEDYIYNNEYIHINCDFDNLIMLYSFSKGFALTGIRLAYIISNIKFINEFHKAALYSFMYPSNLSEYIASNILKANYEKYLTESNQTIRNKIQKAYDKINEIEGLSCDLPEGGLYLFVSLGNLKIDGVSFCNRLFENQHLLAVPGEGSGTKGNNCFRIFVGLDDEVLEKAINRIEKEVHKIKKDQ